jgi:hypothetical protein
VLERHLSWPLWWMIADCMALSSIRQFQDQGGVDETAVQMAAKDAMSEGPVAASLPASMAHSGRSRRNPQKI